MALLTWKKRTGNALNVDLPKSCGTKYTHRTAWRGAADTTAGGEGQGHGFPLLAELSAQLSKPRPVLRLLKTQPHFSA